MGEVWGNEVDGFQVQCTSLYEFVLVFTSLYYVATFNIYLY